MKLIKIIGILVFSLQLSQLSYASIIHQKIVLNKGELLTVDSVQVPYYAFNADTVFGQTNERLKIVIGDSLVLSVMNNTADVQEFVLTDFSINRTIAAGATEQVTLHALKAGIHIYLAGKSGKQIDLWGAAGMLIITNQSDAVKSTFYWNLKDFESQKVLQLDSGKSVDWSTYYPDYFMVNGLGKDQLVGDAASNVKGAVGESILIMLTNTGNVNHSIHFHGYHCLAQEVTSKRVQKGCSKDTFPLEAGDGLILLLVPDKPGFYPVHDHNLIAVSGGGKYPNGIFMVLDIK